MAFDFSAELAQRIASGAAPIVVGLDPRLEALPANVAAGRSAAQRILAFHEQLLPALAPHALAVKPNIAFYERFGSEGWLCYEATCALARAAGLLVIGDIKRGDIGTTAEAYAEAHFAHADAVTLHPYLGRDSIEPWRAHCVSRGKGAFVLVRTSNQSAAEFQDLRAGDGTLCEAVARAVHEWGLATGPRDGYANIGAVVGATWPEQLKTLRRLMPRAWLLLPGVGAQGGTTSELAPAFDARGLGALVSQSRSITSCFAPDDPEWRERVRDAVARFAQEARLVSRR